MHKTGQKQSELSSNSDVKEIVADKENSMVSENITDQLGNGFIRNEKVYEDDRVNDDNPYSYESTERFVKGGSGGAIRRLPTDRVITQEVKSNNKLFSMSQVLLDKKEDYYMAWEG